MKKTTTLMITVLLVGAVLFTGGCATARLHKEARQQLAGLGFEPAPYNDDIMIATTSEAQTISGGRKGYRVADFAKQNHPVLYPLAWAFDYIGIPLAVTAGGYYAADELNSKSDSSSTKTYSAGRDMYVAESKDGDSVVQQSDEDANNEWR